MDIVTTDASVKCGHDGRVENVPGQHWVRIAAALVLVDNDPEGRVIRACPNIGPTMKPCAKTLVLNKGYNSWVRIDGHKIVMDNLDGLTDGTLPGTVHYTARDAGQHFVSVGS